MFTKSAVLYTNLNMASVKYTVTLKSLVFYIINLSFKETVDFCGFLIHKRNESGRSYLCWLFASANSTL